MSQSQKEQHSENEYDGIPYLQSCFELADGSWLELTTTVWAKNTLESHLNWMERDRHSIRSRKIFTTALSPPDVSLVSARKHHHKILELMSTREGPW